MKDKFKLAIGAAALGGIIIVNKNPEVQEVVSQIGGYIANILGEDITGFLSEEWETILTVLGTYYLTRQGERKLSRNRRKKLLKLEHDDMFSITTLDIRKDGRLYVKNQSNTHINQMFPKQDELVEIIESGIARMNYEDNSVIIPFDYLEGSTLYPKMRDNPNIFPEDTLQEIGEKEHGIKRKTTDFIAVLTKSPRYKIGENGEILMVDKKDEEADASSKIRLLTIRRSLIDKTLEWAKENGNSLDFLCNDHNLNCHNLDKYIRYMLSGNKRLKDDRTPVNKLFKIATHRTYMMAIAQMARHIEGGGGYVKIQKQIALDESRLTEDIISSIKRKIRELPKKMKT